MAMVHVDGSCQFSADSQPKSIGLVWGLAATRRSIYIHHMNRVNSRSDFRHDDSTLTLSRLLLLLLLLLRTLTTWHYPHSPAAHRAAVRRAAIDRYLLPSCHNSKLCCCGLYWDRQTDGRTDGRAPNICIDARSAGAANKCLLMAFSLGKPE